uniref:60S ribosomal export protein NMD3 n=1 Tax=Strongyloides venezuelensis TaxID=75913 RepID=A0A0K0FHI4_STRVS
MEEYSGMDYMVPNQGLIACCECGTAIQPNPVNKCVACLRANVDITEGIPKTGQLYSCKFCERYFVPPTTWIHAKLESKELLSICLKKLKPSMSKVRLTDACFIWTEPHSRRVKVKLTVQKEVISSAVLQQSCIVEFTQYNQMCDECRRVEAKDYWRACVQVRQKVQFKKTLFYLEQLILKYKAHVSVNNIRPVPTGIDFYYAKQSDARKLLDFLTAQLPIKYHYSKQLISHDTKCNTYDYKHTYCVEVAPITKDALCILPKQVAVSYGNMNQLVLCQRVNNMIQLIDPSTLQWYEVNAEKYWKDPFEILCQPKQLSEFYVLEVEEVRGIVLPTCHGHISQKHVLADVWLVRSNQVGQSGAQQFSARTHIGHLLNPGDLVLGYDLANSNLNNEIFDKMKEERIPDVIICKKWYDKELRQKKRKWKLKRLLPDEMLSTTSAGNEFEGFMQDLEEDETLREKINIYKDNEKISRLGNEMDEYYDDLPNGPTLEEMLEDLNLDDVEMKSVDEDC